MKKITTLMEEVGLLPDEVELYGDYKAKVRLKCSNVCKMCRMASISM